MGTVTQLLAWACITEFSERQTPEKPVPGQSAQTNCQHQIGPDSIQDARLLFRANHRMIRHASCWPINMRSNRKPCSQFPLGRLGWGGLGRGSLALLSTVGDPLVHLIEDYCATASDWNRF